MADGGAISRVEVGIKFEIASARAFHFGPNEWFELITDVCRLSVRVPNEYRRASVFPLISADRALAQHYLRATTSRTKSHDAAPSDWIQPGEPLLLFEYDLALENSDLPRHARPVENFLDSDLQLSHLRLQIDNRDIGIWFLGMRHSNDLAAKRRLLRLHLFRLHAEREAIKQVFRLTAKGIICPAPLSSASNSLQEFIDQSISLLTRKKRYGLSQSEILNAVEQCEDLVSPGERETLVTCLSHIRPNLLQNISEFTRPTQVDTPTYHVLGETVNLIHDRRTTVNEQKLVIQGNVEGSLQQVAAGSVQSSFNRFHQSGLNASLKEQLIALETELEKLHAHLNPDQHRDIAKDIEIFTQEVVAPAPRPRWYRASAEGIVEVAKAVGTVGIPVVKAVQAVLDLLP